MLCKHRPPGLPQGRGSSGLDRNLQGSTPPPRRACRVVFGNLGLTGTQKSGSLFTPKGGDAWHPQTPWGLPGDTRPSQFVPRSKPRPESPFPEAQAAPCPAWPSRPCGAPFWGAQAPEPACWGGLGPRRSRTVPECHRMRQGPEGLPQARAGSGAQWPGTLPQAASPLRPPSGHQSRCAPPARPGWHWVGVGPCRWRRLTPLLAVEHLVRVLGAHWGRRKK